MFSQDQTIRQVLELVEAKKDFLTIVEGKRDKIALVNLGFTNIVMLETLALYQVVEAIDKGTRVQVLTDLDREGKKLYSKISSDLRQRGVFVDDELREALFRTDLRQIEGLHSFLQRKDTSRPY